MSKNVLVIAAHADDETIGCGATLYRHVQSGDQVFALFLADGVSARPGWTEAQKQIRKQKAQNAANILGLNEITFLDHPDNRLDSLDRLILIQSIEEHIAKVQPNLIYTHHKDDLNIDHRLAFESVMVACRPTTKCSVAEIRTFEVLSSSEWSLEHAFTPNLFINASIDAFDKKIEACLIYEGEIPEKPNARSIEHIKSLATYRGCSVGFEKAEAFISIRKIIR